MEDNLHNDKKPATAPENREGEEKIEQKTSPVTLEEATEMGQTESAKDIAQINQTHEAITTRTEEISEHPEAKEITRESENIQGQATEEKQSYDNNIEKVIKDEKEQTEPKLKEKKMEGLNNDKIVVPAGEHWKVEGANKCEFIIETGAKLTLEGSMKNKIFVREGGEIKFGEGSIGDEVIKLTDSFGQFEAEQGKSGQEETAREAEQPEPEKYESPNIDEMIEKLSYDQVSGEEIYKLLKKIKDAKDEESLEKIRKGTTEKGRGHLVDIFVEYAKEKNVSKDEAIKLVIQLEPDRHVGNNSTIDWLVKKSPDAEKEKKDKYSYSPAKLIGLIEYSIQMAKEELKDENTIMTTGVQKLEEYLQEAKERNIDLSSIKDLGEEVRTIEGKAYLSETKGRFKYLRKLTDLFMKTGNPDTKTSALNWYFGTKERMKRYQSKIDEAEFRKMEAAMENITHDLGIEEPGDAIVEEGIRRSAEEAGEEPAEKPAKKEERKPVEEKPVEEKPEKEIEETPAKNNPKEDAINKEPSTEKAPAEEPAKEEIKEPAEPIKEQGVQKKEVMGRRYMVPEKNLETIKLLQEESGGGTYWKAILELKSIMGSDFNLNLHHGLLDYQKKDDRFVEFLIHYPDKTARFVIDFNNTENSEIGVEITESERKGQQGAADNSGEGNGSQHNESEPSRPEPKEQDEAGAETEDPRKEYQDDVEKRLETWKNKSEEEKTENIKSKKNEIENNPGFQVSREILQSKEEMKKYQDELKENCREMIERRREVMETIQEQLNANMDLSSLNLGDRSEYKELLSDFKNVSAKVLDVERLDYLMQASEDKFGDLMDTHEDRVMSMEELERMAEMIGGYEEFLERFEKMEEAEKEKTKKEAIEWIKKFIKEHPNLVKTGIIVAAALLLLSMGVLPESAGITAEMLKAAAPYAIAAAGAAAAYYLLKDKDRRDKVLGAGKKLIKTVPYLAMGGAILILDMLTKGENWDKVAEKAFGKRVPSWVRSKPEKK